MMKSWPAPWLVLLGHGSSIVILCWIAWQWDIAAALLAMVAMLLSNGAVRVAADMRRTARGAQKLWNEFTVEGKK